MYTQHIMFLKVYYDTLSHTHIHTHIHTVLLLLTLLIYLKAVLFTPQNIMGVNLYKAIEFMY